MNKKLLLLSCALGLYACGGDSSSASDEGNAEDVSSSSYVDPELAYCDSLVDSSAFDLKTMTLSDLRNEHDYKTVVIGSKIWMAENLNYKYCKAETYCYDDDDEKCKTYGRLYTWSVAMDSVAMFGKASKDCGFGKTCTIKNAARGVCPKGWHLPTEKEWNALFKEIGGVENAGSVLKASELWSNNGNGSDSLDFGVLPAGTRNNAGSYTKLGSNAMYWLPKEDGNTNAFYWQFAAEKNSATNTWMGKYNAASVRCVMNTDAMPELPSSSSSSVSSSSSSEIVLWQPSISYGELLDTRDSATYRTVTIGSQVWMAENLRYKYKKGTALSYCYKDKADSCSKYGRLYQWSAAVDSAGAFSKTSKNCGYGVTCEATQKIRGVCPKNWHLPTASEWETLQESVGGAVGSGKMLKSTWSWADEGGLDSFGFRALATGSRNDQATYNEIGISANFWTASETNDKNAYNWYFGKGYNDSKKYWNDKRFAFAVRCVSDEPAE